MSDANEERQLRELKADPDIEEEIKGIHTWMPVFFRHLGVRNGEP